MGPPFDFLDDRLGQFLAQLAAITAGIEDRHVDRLDAFGEERSGAELVVPVAQAAGQRHQQQRGAAASRERRGQSPAPCRPMLGGSRFARYFPLPKGAVSHLK